MQPGTINTDKGHGMGALPGKAKDAHQLRAAAACLGVLCSLKHGVSRRKSITGWEEQAG